MPDDINVILLPKDFALANVLP